MDEIQALVDDDPETSAFFAVTKVHNGLLEWLNDRQTD